MSVKIKNLRKHYGALSPEERLKGIFAANRRRDKEEADALIDAAPRLHFAVPHHFGLGTALIEHDLAAVAVLLGLACAIYQLLYYCIETEFNKEPPGRKDKLELALTYTCYEFVTTLDACKCVCAEYGYDSVYSLDHWGEVLRHSFESAEMLARFVVDDAKALNIPLPSYTADDLAANMREAITRAAYGSE